MIEREVFSPLGDKGFTKAVQAFRETEEFAL